MQTSKHGVPAMEIQRRPKTIYKTAEEFLADAKATGMVGDNGIALTFRNAGAIPPKFGDMRRRNIPNHSFGYLPAHLVLKAGVSKPAIIYPKASLRKQNKHLEQLGKEPAAFPPIQFPASTNKVAFSDVIPYITLSD